MRACVFHARAVSRTENMSKFDSKSQKPFAVREILDALQSGSAERIAEIYREVHPGDIEMAFERLDEDERMLILESLPADVLAEWSDYLTPSELEAFLHNVEETKQKETLDSLSDDELDSLSDDELDDSEVLSSSSDEVEESES